MPGIQIDHGFVDYPMDVAIEVFRPDSVRNLKKGFLINEETSQEELFRFKILGGDAFDNRHRNTLGYG